MAPTKFVFTMAAVVGFACINTFTYNSTRMSSPPLLEMELVKKSNDDSKTTTNENSDKKTTDSYTIVISSYDRFVELAHVIPNWRKCPRVHEIQIIHHNPQVPFPAPLQNFATPPLVQVQWYPENKLTNRFRIPSSDYHTHWIFSVDDDVFIDCRTMDAAFSFQQQHPGALVGFEPRLFGWSGRHEGQGYNWDDACKAETNCSYNTLWTTKGSFLSVPQLQAYWQDQWASVRTLVDQRTTGEDMLMSTVLATQGGSCPTMVRTFHADKPGGLAARPIRLNSSYAITKKGSLGKRTSQSRNTIYQALMAHLSSENNTAGARLCPGQTTTTWMHVDADNSSHIKEVQTCPRNSGDCSRNEIRYK